MNIFSSKCMISKNIIQIPALIWSYSILSYDDDLVLMSLSALFKSHKDAEGVIIKGSVQ